jgi:hypothetical protein
MGATVAFCAMSFLQILTLPMTILSKMDGCEQSWPWTSVSVCTTPFMNEPWQKLEGCMILGFQIRDFVGFESMFASCIPQNALAEGTPFHQHIIW